MDDPPPENQPPDDQQQPDAQPPSSGGPGEFSQQVRHKQISARVPESVARGVFSTGALVMQGNHEIVLDFLLAITRPHQLAARVVLPPGVVPNLIRALRQNLENYERKFGSPPQLPTPQQPQSPPSVEEIYEQLKQPEDVMSGIYANTCMITHTPSEFCFDFITNFYPRSAVACRVFLTAAQAPRFLQTLTRSFEQYQKKIEERRRQMEQQRGNIEGEQGPEDPSSGDDRPPPPTSPPPPPGPGGPHS